VIADKVQYVACICFCLLKYPHTQINIDKYCIVLVCIDFPMASVAKFAQTTTNGVSVAMLLAQTTYPTNCDSLAMLLAQTTYPTNGDSVVMLLAQSAYPPLMAIA
jgi:hypothetical protein